MWTETTKFLIFSLIFHLVYTYSIFDIYFTSPVIHPARRFSASDVLDKKEGEAQIFKTPAKRLVLIVGDGLRADTLYKFHEKIYLPAWAEADFAQFGQVRSETALKLNKDWSERKTNDTKISVEFSFDAAPYLRRLALDRGAWGLSHTRVPTESRPGHVALIAGMYEDVSAVTKGRSIPYVRLKEDFLSNSTVTITGWKLNPIPFDSVLNQSSHTFSFGSPDILPMFARGATAGKVDMESYSEEAEDFTADAANLDIWVLDRLKSLLKRAETNATLDEQLRSPGTVLFLHLLGLDTTGHTYRPKSAEYVGNLMVVNAIIEEVERLLNDFYGSEKDETAYIFTADHGMSNKGNHGDGEPDNTRTPLVAWGSGLRGPRGGGASQEWRNEERKMDDYYSNWGQLDKLWRQDVDQADVAPLMSALLGINMPANSEGVLPLDYLDVTTNQALGASLANALEVLEMFRVKHKQRSSRVIKYVPFKGFPEEQDDREPGTKAVEAIRRQIANGSSNEALESCKKLINLSLEGALYLQTYNWLLLIGVVLTGYLGSIIHGLIFLLKEYVLSHGQIKRISKDQRILTLGKAASSSIVALFFAKFAAEKSPATYYLYVAFAGYYWSKIMDEAKVILLVWRSATSLASLETKEKSRDMKLILSIIGRIVLCLVALEVMVYGYLQRIAWTIGFIVLGLIWPAVGIPVHVKSRHDLLFLLWTLMCTICGALTMSGVDKEESVPFLVASGVLFFIAGALLVTFPHFFLETNANSSKFDGKSDPRWWKGTLRILKIQLVMLVLSTVVTVSSSLNLQQKKGLPIINQALAWFVLVFCLTVPLIYSLGCNVTASHRLILIVAGFAPVFILLSIQDEAIFFGCYSLTLVLWGKVEGAIYEERRFAKTIQDKQGKATSSNEIETHKQGTLPRSLEKQDARIAIYFLFFLHVGFFGTGNIASISSFYLSPVYRLVPIFSPFLMASLLLLKILTPFVILASTFQLICLTLPHPRSDEANSRKTGSELAGPPLFGPDSVGGLGLKDAYSLVLLACISTDVLTISFLVMIRTSGSWLEIGQSITHFVMANLLQVFILALSAVADAVVGKK